MPSALPEPLRGRAFSVREGRQAGLSRKRSRGRDLTAPFWGVRSPGFPTGVVDFALSQATRMPAHSFFSHATAAHLWQIPLPAVMQSIPPIHVSTPTNLRGPNARGLRGHHLQVDDLDIRMLRGMRVTSLERTVFDLAAALEEEPLLAALDNILWRRRVRGHHATRRSLADAFARFTGRRGRNRLLELMPLASDRSDSPPETVFRYRFLRAGFPPALPNEPIRDSSGHEIALPDLQFENFRMAFDYEGDHHRTDKEQWHKDLKRVPRMQDLGWHHTRIAADDLAVPTELIARTHRTLIERGWRPERC
jgi:hypothetical protein